MSPGLRIRCVMGVLVIATFQAVASEPSLEVHLQPRRFGVDDVTQLSVRITEPPSNLRSPMLGELHNLEIVAGPSTGSEFSFVNGVASRAQTFTYVLRALEPGPASVGPVTIRAGEIELRANPVTAEVVEGSVSPPTRRGRRSLFNLDPFSGILPRRAPPRIEVVLRHDLSAREVVVGQPLVATVYLDSTVSSLYDFDWRTAPSYPGFWAQRLDNPEQVTPETVEVGGTRFYRYRVLRSVLVPLKDGPIEIPAVEAAIGVRSWGSFDSGQLIERSTPVRTVEVAARKGANYISLVSMMLPTNDGFIALNGVKAPHRKVSVMYQSPGFDAGTEANDELCMHIPGPQCDGSTSTSDPDDTDEGYVYIHNGIHGIGDLAPATYTWHNPAATISIKRVRHHY